MTNAQFSIYSQGASSHSNYKRMTDKQWDTILALHNTPPFRLVRAAAPYFRVKDGAPRCIINISSTSGVNGNAGQANYGPQLGVRANTVAFGHIQTRLTATKEEGAFVADIRWDKGASGDFKSAEG
ncbi:MAG: hypothetical protein Q9185_000537 [Variospora sp. 1 TL-2023]